MFWLHFRTELPLHRNPNKTKSFRKSFTNFVHKVSHARCSESFLHKDNGLSNTAVHTGSSKQLLFQWDCHNHPMLSSGKGISLQIFKPSKKDIQAFKNASCTSSEMTKQRRYNSLCSHLPVSLVQLPHCLIFAS